MVLRIFILPDTILTFPKIQVADKMKEKVTSSKKNTVITLSDEVTELSSIKCTVENWKVILDTCVQHGSEQNCLVEIDRITSLSPKFRLFSDMNRVLNRRKIQHLLEIHIETYWFQRSLTDFSVALIHKQ
jgi:hypothetical protein